MQLVIDIGNSRVKVAEFNNRELLTVDYFAHEEKSAIEECIAKSSATKGILSTTASEQYQIPIRDSLDVLHLNHDTPLPFEHEYAPKSLGRDRMANVAAMIDSACDVGLAIDMGTCITYNYLLNGKFVGGSISPGLRMRLKAMHTFTGRLPLVEQMSTVEVVVNNTADALLSGAMHGIRLELEGHCTEFLDAHTDGQVFLTGGDSQRFAEQLKKPIFADPLLTLKGLNAILLHQAD